MSSPSVSMEKRSFVLLLLVICFNLSKASVISEAIASILTNNCSMLVKIDLVHFGGTSSRLLDEILNRVEIKFPLKVINGTTKVKFDTSKINENGYPIKYSNDSKDRQFVPWNYELRASSILLFPSPHLFRKFVANITWICNRQFRYKHIVYAPNLTATDVTDTIKNGFDIEKVAFLMNETKKSIELVSSFMFTAEKCHHYQISTINKFDGYKKLWKTQDFFPRKYRKFHKCRLLVQQKPQTMDGRDFIGDAADVFNASLFRMEMSDIPHFSKFSTVFALSNIFFESLKQKLGHLSGNTYTDKTFSQFNTHTDVKKAFKHV